jgi:hypothetical protein
MKADLAARFSTRSARNSSLSSRKLTSVTICRELSDSDQIIKSNTVGQIDGDLYVQEHRAIYARDHPRLSSVGGGVCLRQQTTAMLTTPTAGGTALADRLLPTIIRCGRPACFCDLPQIPERNRMLQRLFSAREGRTEIAWRDECIDYVRPPRFPERPAPA